MASGGEPMPPTGGRGDVCGTCACATPAKTTAINPTNVVARADHVPMLPAPQGQILVAIFHSGAALRKQRIRPGGLKPRHCRSVLYSRFWPQPGFASTR